MIEIISEPPSIPVADFGTGDAKQPPAPLSDCWRWCMQPDSADAVTTPGASATVTVVFPTTCTIPANGAAFKIWGYDFTVQSGSDYTSNSFKVLSSGILTSINFANMILANFYFNVAVEVTSQLVTGGVEVTITWTGCREQTAFNEDQMDFTALVATGGSAAFENGVSPEYVDGYQVIAHVGYLVDATSVFKAIGKFVGLEVDKQCSNIGSVCAEYVVPVQSQLYTDLPDLTSTSFITSIQGGRSLMKLFALEYGWLYRENCISKTGTIERSNIVLGINAAFDEDDPYQMRRYWYNHPDGFPPGQFVADFLTTQPKKISLCWESFKWLWLLNNWQSEYGTYRLVARFALYKKGVGFVESFDKIINDPATDGHAWYQPVNFNVSPQFVLDNAPTLTKEEIEYYEVSVRGTTTGGTNLFNASEILQFWPQHCCEGTTDLYFLTPPGGIGTIVVDIDSKEAVREADEINLQVLCSTGRLDKMRYGGRRLVNVRGYERVSFSVRAPQNMEWSRWLKHLHTSPQHWLRVSDEAGSNLGLGGDPVARKLLLEPGSVKIYETGQGIQFKGVGYLGDMNKQKGIEP